MSTPAVSPSQSGESPHARQTATKCGHELHPSIHGRMQRCPPCDAKVAKEIVEEIQEELATIGGPHPYKWLRNTYWNTVRVGLQYAERRLEKAEKKDQQCWQREKAWENAGNECPTCLEMTPSAEVTPLQVRQETTWWEREEAPAPHNLHRQRHTAPSKGKEPSQSPAPSFMRGIIRTFRTQMQAFRAGGPDMRPTLEQAFRRKHNLGENVRLHPDAFRVPLPEKIARLNYEDRMARKRKQERRARGNVLPPRPPPSTLSQSTSAADFEAVDDDEDPAAIAAEIKKVEREIGMLYIVGPDDKMGLWEEAYSHSSDQLVWRDWDKRAEDAWVDEDVGLEEEE